MAKQLCDTRPEIGVVILTQHADHSLALELFETRSAGLAYLLNEPVANRGELVAAIKALADRRSLVDPSIVDGLIAERGRPPASPPDGLTARERDVLAEVSTGKSDSAIASAVPHQARGREAHQPDPHGAQRRAPARRAGA